MIKIRIILLICLAILSFNLNAQISPEILNLFETKQYSQVITEVDQKLIKNATNQELQYLKAQSQYKLGLTKEAIKTYQSIIRLNPNYPDAYNNLAGIYARQGDLQLAKQTLEKGINTNKSYALLHKNINSIYLEMARESYVKALRLGVKKHNVELSVASLEQRIISPTTSKRTPIVNKPAPKPVTAILKPVKVIPSKVEQRTSTKKVVRRIAGKKKVVIKAWNAPVISAKDEVITALQGWAAAWSAQDVDLYLSFYNKQFLPDNGIARRTWASQRQTRLTKPRWIEVRLSDFLFKQLTEDRVEVSVSQMYRSNSFRDKSKKKFLLKRSNDGWQILNEINFRN